MIATQDRYEDQIKLRFRKMNPHLGMSEEQVLIELLDLLNEDLYALYLPYENFRYGDFLYFTLASTDYLNNGPMPLFLKIELRKDSYETENLPLVSALQKTYRNTQVLINHAYISDNPLDIFLDAADLEKWLNLELSI